MLVNDFITSHAEDFVRALGYPPATAKHIAGECLSAFNQGGFGGGMSKIRRMAKKIARESTGLTGLEATMLVKLNDAGVIHHNDTEGKETRALNQLVKKGNATYDEKGKLWESR